VPKTRATRTLLVHIEADKKPLTSLEAHASPRDSTVSWNGSPRTRRRVRDRRRRAAVSIPGAALVRAAWKRASASSPSAGPSAVTAAVRASVSSRGISFSTGFYLEPHRARRRPGIGLVAAGVILLKIASTHAATLAELAALCPDRQLVVAREIDEGTRRVRPRHVPASQPRRANGSARSPSSWADSEAAAASSTTTSKSTSASRKTSPRARRRKPSPSASLRGPEGAPEIYDRPISEDQTEWRPLRAPTKPRQSKE